MVSVFEGQLTRTWCYPVGSENEAGNITYFPPPQLFSRHFDDFLPIFIGRHLDRYQTFVDYTLSWYHYRGTKCHAQLRRDTRYVGKLLLVDGERWSSIVILGRPSTSLHWNQTKRMDGVNLYLPMLHRWYLDAWSHLQSSTLWQISVYCLFEWDSHDSWSHRPGV